MKSESNQTDPRLGRERRHWEDDAFTQAVLGATRTLRRRERIRSAFVTGSIGAAAIAASLALVFVLNPPGMVAPAGSGLRPHGTSRGYDPATRSEATTRDAMRALEEALGADVSASRFLRRVRKEPEAAFALLGTLPDAMRRRDVPELVAEALHHAPFRAEALPFLRICLDAEDPDLRASALRGIGIACDPPSGCSQTLKELLGHSDAEIRGVASRLLGGS